MEFYGVKGGYRQTQCDLYRFISVIHNALSARRIIKIDDGADGLKKSLTQFYTKNGVSFIHF